MYNIIYKLIRNRSCENLYIIVSYIFDDYNLLILKLLIVDTKLQILLTTFYKRISFCNNNR